MQRVTDCPTGTSCPVSQPISEEVIGSVTRQWPFTTSGEKQSFLQVIKWHLTAPLAIQGFQAGQIVPGVFLKTQFLEYLLNQLRCDHPVSQIRHLTPVSYLDTGACQSVCLRKSRPIWWLPSLADQQDISLIARVREPPMIDRFFKKLYKGHGIRINHY